MAGPWEKYAQSVPENLQNDPVAQEIVQGPKPWEKFDPTKKEESFKDNGFVKGAINALPAAGSVVGGLLGTALGPAGVLGGGALGAAGGKAAENFIKEQFYGDKIVDDAPEDKRTSMERIFDTGENGSSKMDQLRTRLYEPSKEAALDVAAPAVMKAVSAPVKFATGKAAGYLSKFAQPAKEGAEEIAKSAERLGTEATPGMLTTNPAIQDVESALSQRTLSKSGGEYAKKYNDINNALESSAKGLLKEGASPETGIQLATKAKNAIVSGVGEKIAPAAMIYDDIAKEGKFIDVSPESVKRISNNILNLETSSLKGTPENSFANMVADNLQNTTNLQKLRSLKSYVGKVSGDMTATPQMRAAAGDIYGRLGQLEKNSITRSALSAAKNPQQGKAIASDMIAELRGANKIYKEVSSGLKDLAQKSGLGKVRNYSDFVQKIEQVPDEKFVSKLFQQGNHAQLKEFEKQFPEAFNNMKKSFMVDMYGKSTVKGEISVSKFLSNVKKLSPESQKIIFGDGSSQTIKDIENIYNSFPGKVGPSGTPKGESIMKYKPGMDDLRDRVYKFILENPNLFNKAGKSLEKIPETPMGLLKKNQGLLIPTRAIEQAGDSK